MPVLLVWQRNRVKPLLWTPAQCSGGLDSAFSGPRAAGVMVSGEPKLLMALCSSYGSLSKPAWELCTGR
jgi:hypothetical protein